MLTSFITCASQKVIVATEEWGPTYTIKGGRGLWEDIIREVYRDHEIEFVYQEYLRTIALVKNQSADMWLGSYIAEEPYAYYPRTPIDHDKVVSLRFKSTESPSPNYPDANMVWIKGYKYDIYFPDLILRGYEVRDTETAIRLLKSHKADYLLGDESELREDLRAIGHPLDEFDVRFLGLLGLYPGFMNTEKSMKLIKIWDARMQELLASGKLRAFFVKHGIGEKFYHDEKNRSELMKQSSH